MRGDLFRLRPGKDSAGHEQRGPRYAVAIQSDGILLSTLIVAPTSASAQAAIFRPEIEMDGTRTRVLVDQMRAVDASRLGERLRAAAERARAPDAGELCITVSIGVASLSECQVKDAATLLELADARLYRAKAIGRNRVCAED